MKSNLFVMMCAVALVLGVCSCGGGENKPKNGEEITKMLPASAVKFSGDCKDFFEISGDSVKIILTKVGDGDYGWEVRSVFSIAKTPNAKSWKELEETPHFEKPGYAGMFGFSHCYAQPKFLDANGTEINLDLKIAEGINELLKSEEKTAENIVVQYQYDFKQSDYETTKEKFDKVSALKLEIGIANQQFSNEAKPSKASDSDWDSILDEYEKYVDKYVAVYKKAMNGDMNALSESVSLAEQAEKLGDKLSKGQGAMTSAQMNRYTKIVTKMTNAMQ